MKGKQHTPMTTQAASRIASATAVRNGGKIPSGSFASRSDAAAQRQAATPPPGKLAKS